MRLQPAVRAAIESIDEAAWTALEDYPPTSIAQIAETTLAGRRLIVRRVRTLASDAQGVLFDTWKHYSFITDRNEPLALVEAEHRQHAVVELAIRDHVEGPLRHLPSGRFFANAAWTVIAALAANIARWTTILGLHKPTPQALATLRRHLLTPPARLVRSGRQTRLRLPTRWPWAAAWLACLTTLRALPRC